jgi:hypothetical protein
MPELRSLQGDTWVDEEISSLLETVESDANGNVGGAAGALPRRRRPRRRFRRPPGLGTPRVLHDADRLLWALPGLRQILVYGAAALALGTFIGWLVARMTP